MRGVHNLMVGAISNLGNWSWPSIKKTRKGLIGCWHSPSNSERTDFLIDLLIEQFNSKVIFLFDNLELIQDGGTLQMTDDAVRAFLEQLDAAQHTRCIVTSCWQFPNWSGEHLQLSHANYGDFLQIAVLRKLYIKREQMRRVYGVLGGNIRGLEFFVSAIKDRDDESENAFLQTLEQTKTELQTSMSITEIYQHLPNDAKKLLSRLPAYQVPVPLEGLLKLGLDFPNVEFLLEQLIAVSLLEANYKPHWDVVESGRADGDRLDGKEWIA